MEALTRDHAIPVQLIAATHSPMVLASVETRFDAETDGVWELDLRQGKVVLSEFPWSRRGDANAWLTSSVFDLAEPRSIEAEVAMKDALELLRSSAPPLVKRSVRSVTPYERTRIRPRSDEAAVGGYIAGRRERTPHERSLAECEAASSLIAMLFLCCGGIEARRPRRPRFVRPERSSRRATRTPACVLRRS